MLVKVDKEIIKYTGFEDSLDITGATVGEVFLNLFEKYPQLYAFLVCKNGEEANKTVIDLNGVYLVDSSALTNRVNESDVLNISRDVPEGAGSAGKILAGGALLALAMWNPAAGIAANGLLFSSSVAMGVGMMGASLIVGGLGEMMVGKPNLPSDGNSTSNTYTFSGIKNSTVSGTPIPIIYGRHRTGGHVLNAYVDVPVSNGNSYLYAQFGLSEGVIDDIDYNSIHINDRNARDYDDVSAFWRKGESTPVVGVNGTLFSPKSSTDVATLNTLLPKTSHVWTAQVPDPAVITRGTGGKVEH